MRACMQKNEREACWLVELGADVNARSLLTVGHCNVVLRVVSDVLSN